MTNPLIELVYQYNKHDELRMDIDGHTHSDDPCIQACTNVCINDSICISSITPSIYIDLSHYSNIYIS